MKLVVFVVVIAADAVELAVHFVARAAVAVFLAAVEEYLKCLVAESPSVVGLVVK